jgi:hypothetical protein
MLNCITSHDVLLTMFQNVATNMIWPRGAVLPPAGSMLTANFGLPLTGLVGEKATRRSSSVLFGTKPALTGCG